MLLLPLAILVFAVWAAQTLAEHVSCSWSPAGSPTDNGFGMFCTATLVNDTAYTCPNDENKPVTVATWNALAPGVLNIASPCGGGGGWKLDKDGSCPVKAAGLCIDLKDPAHPASCFYLAADDDCAWPGLFDTKSRPEKVMAFDYS